MLFRSDELVTTPDGLEESSPTYTLDANRLIMLVDSEWPQPVISSSETEKAEKKAKRRISK